MSAVLSAMVSPCAPANFVSLFSNPEFRTALKSFVIDLVKEDLDFRESTREAFDYSAATSELKILKRRFRCKKSGYFTKPVKNITNRIFICHKHVNNDTKSNSYSPKRQQNYFCNGTVFCLCECKLNCYTSYQNFLDSFDKPDIKCKNSMINTEVLLLMYLDHGKKL